MGRRALLVLTTMALCLVVAAGTAMAAEPQLDQQQTVSDTRIDVNTARIYQTFTAGVTGKLERVSLYVGCCNGSGAVPAGGVRVRVGDPNVLSSFVETTIPASGFANDGSLAWVDVPLGPAAPTVQAAKSYRIDLVPSANTGPYFQWGYNTAGGYTGGFLGRCTQSPDIFFCTAVGSGTPGEGPADATFKTYVVPDPDTTAPETTIDSGPSGTVGEDDAAFLFSSNEGGSTFECRLDGAPEDDWAGCSSPQPYSDLSEGPHTFEVRATDPSGNADPSPARRDWTVDLPDPPPPPPIVPHVTDTDPDNRATRVARSTKPSATFDADLDPTSVDTRSAKLQVYSAKKGRWVAVPSTPSYSDKVVTVSPANALGSRKEYRVVLATGIESTTHDNLERPHKFRFTTRR
jgi:hypothetical protein